jgi:hypothetical protein
MSHLVISAHVGLAQSRARREVFNWLEELGLEIGLGDPSCLMAFDDAENRNLIIEAVFYSVEPADSTQVRFHVHRNDDLEHSADDLAFALRSLIKQDSRWSEDCFHAEHADRE